MSRLPGLTHQQFLLLGALRSGPRAGRVLRDVLREFGVRKSGPGFYQMMARLEDAGMVVGSYRRDVIDGQPIRERHYRITASGLDAWASASEFYRTALDRFGEEGLAGTS